jgi:hypothetical protein
MTLRPGTAEAVGVVCRRVDFACGGGFRLPATGGEDWRHADLAAELAEWGEDLWQARTGSRVALMRVPPGWGRRSSSSTGLDRFAVPNSLDAGPGYRPAG